MRCKHGQICGSTTSMICKQNTICWHTRLKSLFLVSGRFTVCYVTCISQSLTQYIRTRTHTYDFDLFFIIFCHSFQEKQYNYCTTTHWPHQTKWTFLTPKALHALFCTSFCVLFIILCYHSYSFLFTIS